MCAYTCIKPANFAGVKYLPGDTVPAEAIPADRVGAVIRLGLIAEAQPAAKNEQTQLSSPAEIVFNIPVKIGDGSVENLEVTTETVAEAVSVLQMTAEEAAKRIAIITDATALIVIDACDSRKTVKKAAADRAAQLAELDAEPPETAE